MRRYHGFMADSDRWTRFALRDDDIVISTPSKCGTTWMQSIVGMLVFDRVDLGSPISVLSPWLDMLTRTEEDVLGDLAAQTHRRFIKTHTPLDGLPDHRSVTYLAGARHPLDAVMSLMDHSDNQDRAALSALRNAVVGQEPEATGEPWPDEPADVIRRWIEADSPTDGAGPHSLADFCHQISVTWDRRDQPNVHLFHYDDLWNDLDGQMRRIAEILDIEVDEDRWRVFVDAATLTSMRARAAMTAPEAEKEAWHDPAAFFRKGGRRDWASLLDADDLDRFHARVDELAGDAGPWLLGGQGANTG